MQVEKPQDEVGVSYVRWGRTGRTGRLGTCHSVWTEIFFLRCTMRKQFLHLPVTLHTWPYHFLSNSYLPGIVNYEGEVVSY